MGTSIRTGRPSRPSAIPISTGFGSFLQMVEKTGTCDLRESISDKVFEGISAKLLARVKKSEDRLGEKRFPMTKRRYMLSKI
jgi:hypothetical protein